jgi:hypothetical protein
MKVEHEVICRFRFICTQKWGNLVPIYGKTDQRHCSICNESVHLASTYEELGSHAAARRCVAIFVEMPDSGPMEVMGDFPSEVDPLAEADVYMAYGRDTQAEEILKEHLGTIPGHHAARLKLMEMYFKRKDLVPFELLARELYEMTRGECAEWVKVASMGHSLNPSNPLYSSN